MLKNEFNPDLIYTAVEYLRMSTDMQNPRSPEQQAIEIRATIKRGGRPWRIVQTFKDVAKSGRLLRKRTDYQRMMREIKAGVLKCDLILVDTIERFGRVDDLPAIRRELWEDFGVLVLMADSNFCDPTSTAGRALGFIETVRATEEGRTKAHNVLRGKRDAARQKHWPGGPPPFGFRLDSVMKIVDGREEVDYHTLVHDPVTGPVAQQIFNFAKTTGFGTTRLARMLNSDPHVPAALKPLQPSTIGNILDNTTYYGELVFNKNSTGIVADVRVVDPNPEEDWDRVPDFCAPLVSKELWLEVQALRDAHRARHRGNLPDPDSADDKLLKPTASGMTLKYLLSGLLYCKTCGRRMVISSSPQTNAAGEKKRYAYYACGSYAGGLCTNSTRVPEGWLRETVIGIISQRLFPWKST